MSSSSREIEAFKLENGLQVVLWPRGEGQSVTSILSVNVGSRHEDNPEAGIAHFLEHLLFQKADPKLTEMKGLYNNAYTWNYNTAYWFKGQSDYLEDILEYSRQNVFHPEITDEQVAREKGIILEEWKMVWDNPERFVEYMAIQQKYGDHPLGHHTIGDDKTISSFQRKQFESYTNHFYSPNNAVLVILSDLNISKTKTIIQDKFTETPSKETPPFDLFKDKQTEPKVGFAQRDTNQAVVRFDFKGPGVSPQYSNATEDVWILEVIAAIFAAGNATIFEHQLIDEKELINDYDFSLFWNYEVSDVEASFTGAPQKMTSNIREVVKLYNQLKRGEFNDELRRAKQTLKTAFVFDQEDQFKLAELVARYWFLTGEVFSIEKFLQKIDAVTAEDVQRVAKKYFTADNANLAWVGREEPDMDSLKEILSGLGE